MLMAVDEDGDGLVSFTELVKSLGIKTHEMLQEEKQQKARRGEDDHSVEERWVPYILVTSVTTSILTDYARLLP